MKGSIGKIPLGLVSLLAAGVSATAKVVEPQPHFKLTEPYRNPNFRRSSGRGGNGASGRALRRRRIGASSSASHHHARFLKREKNRRRRRRAQNT